MEVKKETGRRDTVEEPMHPDHLLLSASPKPNIALTPRLLHLPDGTFLEDVLLTELGTSNPYSPLDRAFEAYERRYCQLAEIEFDNSALCMQLCPRLDNLKQHFDYFQSSIGTLGDSSIDGSLKDVKKPRARRKKLQASHCLDFAAIKEPMDAWVVLTEELRASDRHREQAEKAFDNAVASITASLRRSEAFIPRALVEDQSVRTLQPPICSPQPPISSELKAYYHSVSTLRNMGGRVGQLQSEQEEQWERRRLMEEQVQVLDQSDDDFLRCWEETLPVASQDLERAQRDVAFARDSCEDAGVVIPPGEAWAVQDTGPQQVYDDAVHTRGELQSRDGPEAKLVDVTSIERWCEPKNEPLQYPGIKDDSPIPNTTSAGGQYLSDVRKKQICNPSRLARWCSLLMAVMVPLVNATINESTTKEVLSTVTELDGSHSSRNGQNAAGEALRTGFQYALAISPPIILVGGFACSVWILKREKRAFKGQQHLPLMTVAASVSWATLATMTDIGEQGSVFSIITWLALTAMYTSLNFRGLRNGTWHLFVTLLGGLAITSLSALALLVAEEASMEGFVHKGIIVGPFCMTAWSWLAALGQQRLEGPTRAVAPESAPGDIELQDSTNAIPQ